LIRQELRNWFEERYNVEDFRRFARSKRVPSHSYEIWYFTGGATLFLFIIQFITGAVLALYYIPHAEFAHKSIIEIVTKLHMGWFFRSLHHWGAQFAIALVLVHMFGTLMLKSYRKPRELLWLSGCILLGISIFFGLSGYFLLWDERAFAAVRVATGGAGNFPIVGGFIRNFLRGGIDVTGETLTRFYAFHVSILPLAVILVVVAHLFLVQYHGMSVPMSQESKRGQDTFFFPNILYKDLIIWLVLLGLVVTCAALAPPEIGRQADPLAPAPENIKPEWYFLSLFQTLKLFPGVILGLNGETIAIIIVTVAVLFLFLFPFFDRKSLRQERSPVFTWIGFIYIIYFIVMTVIGYFS